MYFVCQKPSWRKWLTPIGLKAKPIHRWYFFPHSFTDELVDALIEEWGLGRNDCLLDPFCGAGTTLLSAKAKAVPAVGYDLSPLAVLATNVKVARFSEKTLRRFWQVLSGRIYAPVRSGLSEQYSELVRRALPGQLLEVFDHIRVAINTLSCARTEREFFTLAMLQVLPRYSRAEATGGWLSWVTKRTQARTVVAVFSERVETMLADLKDMELPAKKHWRVVQADARKIPDRPRTYSAVITSPPYPNRHDYTRVFGVELMLSFLNWEETTRLRYQSFESHPEARPKRPVRNAYVEPRMLARILHRLESDGLDRRILRMIKGYFLDMYLTLSEAKRVCRPSARIAFVVGNAQYCGNPVMVDELTAELGEQAGLRCREIRVVRQRGNSAQQMGVYGRQPARESVVIFAND